MLHLSLAKIIRQYLLLFLPAWQKTHNLCKTSSCALQSYEDFPNTRYFSKIFIAS